MVDIGLVGDESVHLQTDGSLFRRDFLSKNYPFSEIFILKNGNVLLNHLADYMKRNVTDKRGEKLEKFDQAMYRYKNHFNAVSYYLSYGN